MSLRLSDEVLERLDRLTDAPTKRTKTYHVMEAIDRCSMTYGLQWLALGPCLAQVTPTKRENPAVRWLTVR